MLGHVFAAGPALLGFLLAAAAAAGEPPDGGPPSACQGRLSEHAAFQSLGNLGSSAGCGASDAVRLERVILKDNTEVAIQPPATLRCEMAEAVTEFVRSDLAPAAAAMGAPLSAIGNFDSYECRSRNRVPGAKLSEHALANALDIRSITLRDGRVVKPADAAAPPVFRTALKTAACERFSTVLGPGSDGYHEDHVHVDLLNRHSGYRLCRWDVREEPQYALQAMSTVPAEPPHAAAAAVPGHIPLPRPRPVTIAGVRAVALPTGRP